VGLVAARVRRSAGRARRGRGRPAVARQRSGGFAVREKPDPARRPAATRPAATGHTPARRPGLRTGPCAGQGLDDAGRPRPLPRTDSPAPSGPVPVYLGGLLRGAAGVGRGTGDPESGGSRRALGDGGSIRVGDSRGQPQRVAGGGEPCRRAGSGAGRRRGDLDGQEGRLPSGDLGRRHGRRPLQRPGRGDRAAAAGRARRHGRQVPGPGSAGLDLLHDHLHPGGGAPRHGVPLQPEPPQRSHVASPLPGGSRCQSGSDPRPRPHASPEASSGLQQRKLALIAAIPPRPGCSIVRTGASWFRRAG
jgi:hypothetical protein